MKLLTGGLLKISAVVTLLLLSSLCFAQQQIPATPTTQQNKEAPTKESKATKSKGSKKKKGNATQDPVQPIHKSFRVEGGVFKEEPQNGADSLKLGLSGTDSTKLDSLGSVILHSADSLKAKGVSATPLSLEPAIIAATDPNATEYSAKEKRRMEREAIDSLGTRHSAIFRDSIPISRMCAISLVVPGFGQLYNKQYWKIPVLYGALATSLYFGITQNKQYSNYKYEYDKLICQDASRDQIDPVQAKMIQHNTARQIGFGLAVATYIYFIGDGAVNYASPLTTVKKATTLSTICPGAGQFYNKSYWKVPIVVGGFATMAYMIDWNNRGYQRYKLLYNKVSAGGTDEYNRSADNLKNYRDQFRRNRDLCIILTGAFYLLNIVDAHVDAHLKDYDISDDLAINIQPSLTNFTSIRSGYTNLMGASLSIRF